MLRRSWRPLAAVTAAGTTGYLYYAYKPRPETFDLRIRVKGPDGKRAYATKTFQMLPLAEVEARLRQHATSNTIYRPGGIAWKYTTAQLASNDPIEDAHASAIVERDPAPESPDGDYLFFSVMDGHGGPYTSRLLSKTLIPAVALQLKQLNEEPSTFIPKTSHLDNLNSLITSKSTKSMPFDADPKYVSLAIQTAFAMADSEIVNAPLRIIAERLITNKSKKKKPLDFSQHPMAVASMLPALSGAFPFQL